MVCRSQLSILKLWNEVAQQLFQLDKGMMLTPLGMMQQVILFPLRVYKYFNAVLSQVFLYEISVPRAKNFIWCTNHIYLWISCIGLNA